MFSLVLRSLALTNVPLTVRPPLVSVIRTEPPAPGAFCVSLWTPPANQEKRVVERKYVVLLCTPMAY
jgi:hypothetical protein